MESGTVWKVVWCGKRYDIESGIVWKVVCCGNGMTRLAGRQSPVFTSTSVNNC